VKRFSWILTVPLIVVAVVFLTSNREPVTLDLWPFELSLHSSLHWVLLACVAFGLVVGSMATWLSTAPARRRARQVRQQMAELARDRAAAAANSGQSVRPSPAIDAPAADAPEPERRRALGRY